MIKVLIADDEFIMRQGLKYIINWESEGFEIVGEASNGQEAMELVEKLQPHIIISDIVMPVLDGVDFSQIIHEAYPNIQLIILSGYDKFEFVKNTLMNGAVDYILKPTLTPQELLKTLKKAVERIPDYCISNETAGTQRDGIERKLERYLIGQDVELPSEELSAFFHYTGYRIFAVNIRKENAARVSITEMLYKKLERELQDFADMDWLLMMLREETACVVLNYDDDSDGNVVLQLKSLNDKLHDICEPLFGVCSRRFLSFRQILEVYQTDIAPNVYKTFYYQGVQLLMAENLDYVGSKFKKEKFDFTAYNHLLGGKQYEKAADMLTDYSESCIKVQMDVYGLKNQMKNMIYHFLEHIGLSDNEVDDKRYDFFSRINEASYADAYRQVIKEIMQELKELSGSRTVPKDDRMERLLYYISQNYQEDLKLTDLSRVFNLNYSYLSSYFNQEMKEGFNDYLNRIRIEQACRLLKETGLPIAEVGSQVGYADHSYFCRVFKKITGRTPSEWKRTGNI